MQHPERLVIRFPNWLGDAVMATPLLTDFATAFPNCQIAVTCSDAIGELLKHNPAITKIIPFSRNRKIKQRESKRLINILREEQFDTGLLLTNSFSSAFQFWKAKIPTRIGYKTQYRNLLLSHAVRREETKEHLVDTYKRLLLPFGIKNTTTAPTLVVTEEEKNRAYEQLLSHDIQRDHVIIGINPGAAYGSAKCWPPEYFKELARRLIDYEKVRLVFFGDTHTSSMISSICENLPFQSVVNFAGCTTIRELVALLACSTLVVTNDSGPMHIAAALKKPLLALFGSTNQEATGPYQHGIVLNKRASCSPCYLRKCPIDFRCMRTLSVNEVYRTIEELL